MNEFAINHHPRAVKVVELNIPDQQPLMFPLHQHDNELELSLIIQGDLEYSAYNNVYRLSEKTLIIKHPKLVHYEKRDSNRPIKEICILLTGVQLEGMSENTIARTADETILNVEKNFDLLKELFYYINEKKEDTDEKVLNCLLYLVLEDLCCPIGQEKKKTKDEIIDSIKDYLDNNYKKKIKLEDLSAQFYISPFYLERKFKEKTGFSINRYLLERRIGEAQKLLIYTNDDIKTIGEKSGFDDIHYFYAAFKKYTSMTPVQLRQKYMDQ